MNRDFWLMVNEEKVGPVDAQGIQDLIEQGLITLDTECRRGDGPWSRVRMFDLNAPEDPPKVTAPAPPAKPKVSAKIASVVAQQLDTEHTWRWWFGLSPVKMCNVVLSAVGVGFMVIPVLMFLASVVMFVVYVSVNGLAGITGFTGRMMLGLAFASIPLFITGTVILAVVELAARFCFIEEHLRAIREKQ